VLPEKLIQSLQGIKGFDEDAFVQVHASGGQVTSVRVNPAKVLDESNLSFNIHHSSFNTSKVPWCAPGYYLSERPLFTADPLLHAGAYYVQEASSMFLWHVLQQAVPLTQGVKVLDLCAAPGGKSTLLASYFKDGLLVSNEVIKSRANILVENISKWGSDNVIVSNNDPKDFARLENYFDVMVVDAPCSGSGLFRRDEDAIAEWSEDNVQLCAQRQQRIIANVLPALKQDGIFIYSTCSYSQKEDEDILDWIMQEFNMETIQLPVNEAWNIIEVESAQQKAYGYRFYPYKVKGEGFFIAGFKKKDGYVFNAKMPALTAAAKQEQAIAADWLKEKEGLFLFNQQQNILAVPQCRMHDVALLQKHLYLRKAGVTVGAVKGKELVPHHELALSLLVHENVQRIELSYEQSLNYLKKKDMQFTHVHKGWACVTYKQINLGWIKALPNRVNNYYPVEWRILKDF
jgi:16S rRNA C967 or C1407 C5-methylase (RsmB/RsmF family)/NOL1/NOP2/fmu family ribosome biogenesis protein